MTGRGSRLLLLALAVLAAAGLVLQNGSLHHTHAGDGIGLYNQEHDLTLLASLAANANPADAPPSLLADGVSAAVPVHAPTPHAVRHTRSGHTRAPPSA